MNRKGSLTDAMPILFGFFLFAVASLFIVYVINAISPAFNQADTPPEASALFNTGKATIPGVIDNIGAVMIIGIPLIAAGLAYMLNASAIFFWILTIFSALFVIAGGTISFLWEQIAGAGAPMAGVAAQLPIITWTMENFAIYALFVVVLLLASIFMRLRNQEGSYSGI